MKARMQEGSHNAAKVPRKAMQTCMEILGNSQICHVSNRKHVNCDRRHHNIVLLKTKTAKKDEGGGKNGVLTES